MHPQKSPHVNPTIKQFTYNLGHYFSQIGSSISDQADPQAEFHILWKPQTSPQAWQGVLVLFCQVWAEIPVRTHTHYQKHLLTFCHINNALVFTHCNEFFVSHFYFLSVRNCIPFQLFLACIRKTQNHLHKSKILDCFINYQSEKE